MKDKTKLQLAELLGPAFDAVFEHGKAMQRLEDAMDEHNMYAEDAQEALAKLQNFFNAPKRRDLN